jgi:molybdopterin molybdotransferase
VSAPALSATEAAAAIVAALAVQPSLRLPLADAVGHVLAEDVVAPLSLPPWTNASMDGYAVRAVDVTGASAARPVTLRVAGTAAAGSGTPQPLAPGEAWRIYTGGPVPDGADSVIRQEDTDLGRDRVTIHDARDMGRNVRSAGGDLREGTIALAAGTAIGPHQLALLAALAVTHPMVRRRPRVGVLASGDELVSLDRPEEIVAGRKLADVNTPALIALIADAGGIPVPLELVRDNPSAIRAAVMTATDVDLLITAGGVSVGDHDHVRGVMAALDVSLVFGRVRIRPGGPAAFGVLPDGRAWLGLPGNPVSAMMTFELFGRPAIRAMAGHREPLRELVDVMLAEAVARDPVLDLYLRALLTAGANGVAQARLTGPQGSGMLTSMAWSDGAVIIPAGTAPALAGTTVKGWRWFTS